MKKSGILHAELSRTVASMGHLDTLVIGDAGLPVPKGVAVIDLALTAGVPTFLETLQVVLSELHVQKGVIDAEQAAASPQMAAAFKAVWPEQIELEVVPHAELQARVAGAKAVLRTGEFTPYSNIVLVAGVLF